MSEEKHEESWIISEGETLDGLPNIIRLREDLPGESEMRRLKTLVLITWAYESEDGTGLPSEVNVEKMERLEDLMDEGLVEKGFGRLMTVYTGEGVKEWQLYTDDIEAFIQQFNEMLKNEEVFPLEIDVYEDEGWEGYRDYRDLIAE